MASEDTPASLPAPAEADQPAAESAEDFGALLSEFERGHTHNAGAGSRQLEGTVVSLSAEDVFLDIGYKTEGVLPRASFADNAESVNPGDVIFVSVKGRNEEGYYELSRFRVAQPRDWSALQAALDEKLAVAGTVTGAVKGGLTVDIGVRAFLPASRSGARDAAELEKLVGTEITCRVTRLDVTDENVVVDRRVVLEEQARASAEGRLAAMQPGDVLTGTVRSLAAYGAFVDIGGVDGLLHVSDIAWSRVSKPEDVLSVGQEIRVRILKIDPGTKKISLGLKQLQPEPWLAAAEKYQPGQRVAGAVTRLADFGAFVEIEPGVEGLIHVSEMAWGKKVRHPGDMLKPGDQVDAVILAIQPGDRRISLGLKQALADPWVDAQQRFPVGSQIEGPITRLMNFGAFVELADGIEGLVHVSEISAEKRIHHPAGVLRVGQRIKARVLAIDAQKRQMKLSIKQLVPTGIDEYIAGHKSGDTVSGRVVQVSGYEARVELGEGINGVCRMTSAGPAVSVSAPAAGADLSALTSMLQARWKGKLPASQASEPLSEGQIRSFTITGMNAETKLIELALAES